MPTLHFDIPERSLRGAILSTLILPTLTLFHIIEKPQRFSDEEREIGDSYLGDYGFQIRGETYSRDYLEEVTQDWVENMIIQ